MSARDDFRRLFGAYPHTPAEDAAAFQAERDRERARDAISADAATEHEWETLSRVVDGLRDGTEPVPYTPTVPAQEFTRRAAMAHNVDRWQLTVAQRSPLPDPPPFGVLPADGPMPGEWFRTRADLDWCADNGITWDLGIGGAA